VPAEKYAALPIRFDEILIHVDGPCAPGIGRVVERIKRFDVLAVELIPSIGMKYAYAGLAIGEVDKDDTVLEVLAITGRKSHTTLRIQGVFEGPG
jgi:hypothetical protein